MPELQPDEALTDADRVSLWLMSSDGVRAVKAALQRWRLSSGFDTDLVVKTIHAADLMTKRGEAIESIPAWTKRTLALRASDLLRSPRGKVRGLDLGNEDHVEPVAAVAGSTVTDGVRDLFVEMDVVELRRYIGGRWGGNNGWRLSAALT